MPGHAVPGNYLTSTLYRALHVSTKHSGGHPRIKTIPSKSKIKQGEDGADPRSLGWTVCAPPPPLSPRLPSPVPIKRLILIFQYLSFHVCLQILSRPGVTELGLFPPTRSGPFLPFDFQCVPGQNQKSSRANRPVGIAYREAAGKRKSPQGSSCEGCTTAPPAPRVGQPSPHSKENRPGTLEMLLVFLAWGMGVFVWYIYFRSKQCGRLTIYQKLTMKV